MNKYTGTFRKADGTTRTMNFITERDAHQHFGTTSKDTSTTGTKTTYGTINENGNILVFDLDVANWRYFNTKTQIGSIEMENGFAMTTGGSTRH